MAIKTRDKAFPLRKITYVDYKHIEMNRVLTMLFPSLKYDGYGSRRAPRKLDLQVEDFLVDFMKHDERIISAAEALFTDSKRMETYQQEDAIDPEWFPSLNEQELKYLEELVKESRLGASQLDVWFRGLTSNASNKDIINKWIETDLMDVVNRGKPNQAVAAPRPLHGNTYKFRNARYTRDYGAADQLYWMLYYARQGRGQISRDSLKRFFFRGVDLVTDRYDPGISVDVETQALLHLDRQVSGDRRDSKEPEKYPPLCIGQADLLADDILRLLAYQSYIPRSVLVEYLKTLFAFHLALYHIRLLHLLPAFVKRRRSDTICLRENCPMNPRRFEQPQGNCPYQIGLVVEMGDLDNTHMIELAKRSADMHYRQIPTYVQAHFVVKKLDEMAEYLSNKIARIAVPAVGYFSVEDLLQLTQPLYSKELEAYFKARLVNLVEGISSSDDLDPEIRRIIELDLSDFETYIEALTAVRGRYHRQYITECLDSFLLKNTEAGLLRQARVRGSQRYFSIGMHLLEVLLQIAVLTPESHGYFTRELRIEELLAFLRERYGVYIDRLPVSNGFTSPSILDQYALRKNVEALKTRLRELGFFQELSDAYLTQTITPRYTIQPQANIVTTSTQPGERS
jgi:hypothetical protein